MIRLSDDIVQFFHSQHFIVVSSVDKSGMPHSSCKGIVRIGTNGEVYLMDLYKGRTYENLIQNPCISLTAVDEHKFRGYCLKGKASIIKGDRLTLTLLTDWKKRIAKRITHRVLKNIRGEKGHPLHPEARLPIPEYLILMKTENVVDLTPGHLKQEA